MSADYLRASVGDRAEDRERIRSVSPALLADRVRIPILLMHGTDDTVVPIDQSRRMQRALRPPAKSCVSWNCSDAPTRVQMLREMETFLAQNLRAAAVGRARRHRKASVPAIPTIFAPVPPVFAAVPPILAPVAHIFARVPHVFS